MNLLDILKQALTAFEEYYINEDISFRLCEENIAYLRAAIAELEKAEPVAWRKKLIHEVETGEVYEEWKYSELHNGGIPLLRNAEPLYKALEIET